MPGKSRNRNGLIASSFRLLGRGAKLAEILVFPSACRRCGKLLEQPGERIVCPPCLNLLVPCPAPYCTRCGRFFDGDGEPHACAACVEARAPFSVHRSAARYEGAVKDVLLLFKYRSLRPLGRPLAGFVHAALRGANALWADADFLVPVPLHRRRRRERGFNQAEVLAEELSRLSGLPVQARLMRKILPVRPQTSLRSDERRTNVRGAYRVVRPDDVGGKTIILVDDVFTTGSTMRECALMLRRAGAKDVRGLTVARA